MPWVPPTFVPGVVWQDSPSNVTALSAANLNLDENTLGNFAIAVGTSLNNYLLANLVSTVNGVAPDGAGNVVVPRVVQVNGVAQTQRSAVDLVAGTGIALTVSDDPGGDRTIVTISLAAPVNVTPPVIT